MYFFMKINVRPNYCTFAQNVLKKKEEEEREKGVIERVVGLQCEQY